MYVSIVLSNLYFILHINCVLTSIYTKLHLVCVNITFVLRSSVLVSAVFVIIPVAKENGIYMLIKLMFIVALCNYVSFYTSCEGGSCNCKVDECT
jgi:hypothetical protein